MTNPVTPTAPGAEQPSTLAEMFPIPAEARALERFLGSWDVDGTLTVEGNPLPLTGEWHFAPAAGGWGLKGTLHARIEGLGAYEEDDLFGFDVETGLFHLYSLTNSGAVHDHEARWTSADILEFSYEGLQGGKPYRELGQVEVLDGGRLRAESTDYVDGELATSMDVMLRRR